MIEPSIIANKFRIQAEIEETYFDSFTTTPSKWFLLPAQLEVLQFGSEDENTENPGPRHSSSLHRGIHVHDVLFIPNQGP